MNNHDDRPIGVFDSGLGGLTAVTHMADIMPNESFIYFGDTARTPYGSKSITTIERFSAQISDFLVENGAKIIVIACNTVSATCLEFLRERHPNIPIIGMIVPAAKKIAFEYGNDTRVGIIGTKVTVNSKQYEKKIKELGGQSSVFSKACPLFVPMIEEGITDWEVVKPVIRHYLDEFISENEIDTLVLGCTHYPLIKREIGWIYKDLKILNPSEIVAEEVKKYLEENQMTVSKAAARSCFYASDMSDAFLQMIKKILGNRDIEVKYKNFSEIRTL